MVKKVFIDDLWKVWGLSSEISVPKPFRINSCLLVVGFLLNELIARVTPAGEVGM